MQVTNKDFIILVKVSFFRWNVSFHILKDRYQQIFEIHRGFRLGHIRRVTLIFFDQFTQQTVELSTIFLWFIAGIWDRVNKQIKQPILYIDRLFSILGRRRGC